MAPVVAVDVAVFLAAALGRDAVHAGAGVGGGGGEEERERSVTR